MTRRHKETGKRHGLHINFKVPLTYVERFKVQRSGLKKTRTAHIKGIVFSSGYKYVSFNVGTTGIPNFD